MDIVKRLLAICAAGAAILLVILAIGRGPAPSSLAGHRAPEFDLMDYHGASLSIRDVTIAPAVMCFWLMSDPNAAETVSMLDKLAQDRSVSGMVVAAINCDASPEEMAKFVKGKKFTCIMLHMGDDAERLRTATQLYHLGGHQFPRFFLVHDKDDQIAADLEGPQTAQQLKQKIREVNLLPWVAEKPTAGAGASQPAAPPQ